MVLHADSKKETASKQSKKTKWTTGCKGRGGLQRTTSGKAGEEASVVLRKTGVGHPHTTQKYTGADDEYEVVQTCGASSKCCDERETGGKGLRI